jgi:hypothetical protein
MKEAAMFTRALVTTEIPPAEDMPLNVTLCPPHDFEAGWASPHDAANHDDTVPALYCHSCGDVRAFRIPTDG